MFKKPSTYRSISVVMLLALFVLTFSAAGVAEAYVARSGGGSAVAYGVARSQAYGSTPTQPTPTQPTPTQPTPTQPTPSQPAYYSSGAYGIARSGGTSGSISRPTPSQPTPSQPTPSQPTPSQPTPSQPTPTQPTPTQPTPPPGNISGLNSQERLLFNLVNSERASRGLKPLQLDSRLTYLARLKSQDMINHNYFAHRSPTYGSAGDMIRGAGIPFTLAAENIGVGGNINAIFSAFMNSSGHRNKILGSRYTHTGIGIIYQPGRGYLVTQLFIQPR